MAVSFLLTGSATRHDPRFVYYLLRHEAGRIKAVAGGAATPIVNKTAFSEVKVRVPDLATQSRIGAVLEAYDDLIENNRCRIGILEEMVRAIYREWFVEFRAPGVRFRKATAAEKKARGKDVFPNEWSISTLEKECDSIEDGDWIETKDQGGSDFRLIQVSNIGVGEFIETGKFRHVTRATFERLHCREVLPGMILVARMPDPVGRAWLVTPMPWRMVTAVDVAIVQPAAAKLRPQYCVNMLNSPESLDRANVRTTGTTRARLTRRDLGAMPLLLPAMGCQDAFESIAASNYELSNALRRKNENLRATRDLLLPRLMSGEVSIENLEFVTGDEQVGDPAEVSK